MHRTLNPMLAEIVRLGTYVATRDETICSTPPSAERDRCLTELNAEDPKLQFSCKEALPAQPVGRSWYLTHANLPQSPGSAGAGRLQRDRLLSAWQANLATMRWMRRRMRATARLAIGVPGRRARADTEPTAAAGFAACLSIARNDRAHAPASHGHTYDESRMFRTGNATQVRLRVSRSSHR
jgi:hypothetical protein